MSGSPRILTAYFNPRSREGSDGCNRLNRQLWLYFNPRSREGSDMPEFKHEYPLIISIHAPARGATLNVMRSWLGYSISIHAPARGATCMGYRQIPVYLYFNPRSREGSDRILYCLRRIISRNFNPRSREGSDKNH